MNNVSASPSLSWLLLLWTFQWQFFVFWNEVLLFIIRPNGYLFVESGVNTSSMLLWVILSGYYNVNVDFLDFPSLVNIHQTIMSAWKRPMGSRSCYQSKKKRGLCQYSGTETFSRRADVGTTSIMPKSPTTQNIRSVPFFQPLLNSIWMGIRKCHVLWFRRILLHRYSQFTHAPLLIIVARRAPFRDICARSLLETHRFMWELHAILSETSRLLTVDSLLCYHALWAAPEIGFVEDPIGRRNVFQFVCGPYFPLSAHLSRVSGPHEVTHEKWSKIVHG